MSKLKVGVFSDIHSNYYAFKACFEHAINEGASQFIFLGDYISDLSEPRKTLDLMYEIKEKYPCYFVRGNRERYMLDCRRGKSRFSKDANSGSLFYTYERLEDKDLDFFESLPFYDNIIIDGIPFEIAHSAMDNDRFYFDMDHAYTDSVFDMMKAEYFLTGHTHRQYIKTKGDKTIINAGSVGMPRDYGCIAQYCLIEIEDGKVSFSLLNVSYDVEKTIKAQFESGLCDYAKYWAVSVLYDVITGMDHTQTVLKKVHNIAKGDLTIINDVQIWQDITSRMGMKHDLNEILELCRNTKSL